MARQSATVAATAAGPTLLVWIDHEHAVLARWEGEPRLERVVSEVPPRHESTGHVRFDPVMRHGGGGAAQDKIERDRKGHIRTYVAAVAKRIAPDEDVEILGPAGVRDELARWLRAEDAGRGRRSVATAPCGPLTDRQLIARVRARAGQDAPRVRPARLV